MRWSCAILCLVIASRTLPCAASDAWTALVGDWQGAGTVRGMSARISLQWRVALDGGGRHLRFHNAMRAGDGSVWNFHAEALYLCDADGTCRGHWYDSRGTVLPLVASSHPDRLEVEWGDAHTERGRTRYALQRDGSLAITDEVQREDGSWTTFGTSTATRRASEPER